MIVFYTDWLLKEWMSAQRIIGTIVFIRPCEKDNKGLHLHEEDHCWKWKKLPFIHTLMYHINDQYRLKTEASGYKHEVDHGRSLEDCAWNLSNNYDLDISIEDAKLVILNADNNIPKRK